MTTAGSLPTGTVTFLFTDIEGSTRMLQELGDVYARSQEEHASILREAIAAGGGREIRTEGDAFFAVFPTALGSLRAAVAAQRALSQHGWAQDRPIRVRMGMHTGEGVLGGDDYLGIDVNRAARIAAAGHGEQVLLSEATRVLVEQDLPDGVELIDLGEHRLDDLALPMRIFQARIEGLQEEFPPLETLEARPTNLPSRLSSFVGRERELARVKELVEEQRLVTLTGPGGAGKTRLALQVAADLLGAFHDGAFFVDLATLTDPDLVPLSTARALGLSVDPGGDPARAVRAHVRDRALLLVFDNFEQVAEGAGVVADLLAAAPRLRVLVTSRVSLGIVGEQEYPVPPLSLPGDDAPREELSSSDAVALFLDRARAVQPDLDPSDEDLRAVAAIAARLDGLPLAIELAASRTRVLDLRALLARLDHRLPLLAVRDPGRPERHRTLRAAIAWSYELLDQPERRLFARLSVFPGGCSLAACEAVGDAGDVPQPVLDVLERLVAHSLVRRTDGVDGEPRFGMLETILEYAGERLEEDVDGEATRRRRGAFLLAFAEEAEPHLTTTEQVVWLDRCERERANFRATVAWAADTGEVDPGLRIAAALWQLWKQRGPVWEGRATLDRLLALGGSPAVRAKALGAAGGLAWWADDFSAARRHYQEAVPLARSSGDRRLEMEALYNLAYVSAWSDDAGPSVAEGLFRESAAIADEVGDRRGIARARGGLGLIDVIARGDFAAAARAFQQVAETFEELGERSELIDALVSLGNARRRLGDADRAKTHYLKALDMLMAAGSRPMSTGLLFLISALEGERGRHERAVRLWGGAEVVREVTGAVRPPVAARLIGDPIAEARAALGDDAVEHALAHGSAMDLEEAIAYAHHED